MAASTLAWPIRRVEVSLAFLEAGKCLLQVIDRHVCATQRVLQLTDLLLQRLRVGPAGIGCRRLRPRSWTLARARTVAETAAGLSRLQPMPAGPTRSLCRRRSFESLSRGPRASTGSSVTKKRGRLPLASDSHSPAMLPFNKRLRTVLGSS
jgi:hypothetical protein